MAARPAAPAGRRRIGAPRFGAPIRLSLLSAKARTISGEPSGWTLEIDVRADIPDSLKSSTGIAMDPEPFLQEASLQNVEGLFEKIEKDPSTNIQISVDNKSVKCEEIEFMFDLDDFSQKRILEGLDKIDITLDYMSDIENFNKSRKNWKPKLA